MRRGLGFLPASHMRVTIIVISIYIVKLLAILQIFCVFAAYVDFALAPCVLTLDRYFCMYLFIRLYSEHLCSSNTF